MCQRALEERERDEHEANDFFYISLSHTRADSARVWERVTWEGTGRERGREGREGCERTNMQTYLYSVCLAGRGEMRPDRLLAAAAKKDRGNL